MRLKKSPVFGCILCALVLLCYLTIKFSLDLNRLQELRLKSTHWKPARRKCPKCVPCEMKNADCGGRAAQGDCVSCDYKLERLEGVLISAFNTTKPATMGKTDVFLYRIVAPGTDSGGDGWPSDILVKVPLPYYRHANIVRHLGSVVGRIIDSIWSGMVLRNRLNYPCKKKKSYDEFRLEVAVWRLAQMCEVGHLFPEMRFGPVRGTMPESGYEITEHGLFMTKAEGMTLRAIETGVMNNDITKDIFTRRVNSSQVVEAAIFDLLTGQGDRNSGNIFIDEVGNILLIDNSGLASDPVNSVLFPATFYHTRMIVGKQYLLTGAVKYRNKYPPPGSRMDYRCHSRGIIGKNYPPGLEKCMNHIRSAPIQTLASELGLESEWMLTYVQKSAEMLLSKGFEWTLTNLSGREFLHQKPCCDMTPVISPSDGSTSWSCGHDWSFNYSLIDSGHKQFWNNLFIGKSLSQKPAFHC